MSCETNANKTASAGIAAGLTRLAAKSAYARTMRRNIAFTRRALTAIRNFLAGAAPSEPATVRELSAKPTASPVTPPTGQTCAKCGRTADRGGTWYRLDGKYYCTDCAPAAAQKSGVSLTVSAPHRVGSATDSRSPTTNTSPRIAGQPLTGVAAVPTPSTTDGKPVTITKTVSTTPSVVAKSVELAGGGQTMVNVDGYRLRTATGQDTGLAITPLLTVTGGQPRAVPDRWRITHLASGRDVTPLDFPSPEAAFGLGQLLGQFDWNRPFENFSRRELSTVRATINAYQNAVTQVTQPTPSGRTASKPKGGIPLDAPLHDKLVVDGSGEVVRVFDDLGETLVVTDVLGQSYNVPRLEVRLPDEEDFANTDLAYPMSEEELLNETACSNCNRAVGQNSSLKWYRMKGSLLCEHCARVFGPSMNLYLPDTVL